MSSFEHVSKQMLKQHFQLVDFKRITNNLDNIIKIKLKDLVEGVCYNDGYILNYSINIFSKYWND